MRFLSSLLVAAFLIGTVANAAENQPTTDPLQKQERISPTTNSLNKPGGQQTTTGLAAHSRNQPTSNNLQVPPDPKPNRPGR